MPLDLTAEVCPMTFIKTKVAMHELSKGEVLEVLLCGEEPLKNVSKAIEECGDKIISVEKGKNSLNKLIIEKG